MLVVCPLLLFCYLCFFFDLFRWIGSCAHVVRLALESIPLAAFPLPFLSRLCLLLATASLLDLLMLMLVRIRDAMRYWD